MAVIHQLVHGYLRGHELLAASSKLNLPDADLVLRLSDLSGTLTNEDDFRPYITAYPLPSRRYYALGKTWMDKGAARAGCVLTHTLLVPNEIWSNADARYFFALFALPSRTNLAVFQTPLTVAKPIESLDSQNSESDRYAVSIFVAKYFGEGIKPIVWLDQNAVGETLLASVINALWPKLRAEFASCTWSLQPRYLDNKPFDLLFAPPSAYSRFRKLAAENFVDTSNHLEGDVKIEPWCKEIVDSILFPGRRRSSAEFDRLKQQLSEDPASVKRLFLIQQLRSRLQTSPTAAVGMLDVVESIARDPSAALEVKRDAISEAFSAIDNVKEIPEALRCFMLLSERLSHPAFTIISPQVAGKMSMAISSRTSMIPETALKFSQTLVTTRPNFENSMYMRGVLKGLRRLGLRQPAKLMALQHYPNLAPLLIQKDPFIAVGYLDALRTTKNEKARVNELISWLDSIQDGSKRARLRSYLLPKIKTDLEAPVLAGLLENMSNSEVADALTILNKNTRGFKVEGIRKVIEEKVAIGNSQSLRQWALNLEQWTPEIASLVAASYPSTVEGFDILLNSEFTKDQQAILIAQFLRKIVVEDKYPVWFVNRAKSEPRFLQILAQCDSHLPSDVIQQIWHVLNGIRDIPVAAVLSPSTIGVLAESGYGDLIVDISMRSLTKGFLEGAIDISVLHEWHAYPWATKWIDKIASTTLSALFSPSYQKTSSLVRAWQWMATAPSQLFDRTPSILHELLEAFINASFTTWPQNTIDLWLQVLQRSKSESPSDVHLKLCVQALQYAFDNPDVPVGEIVAETYYDVYSSVISQSSDTQDFGELFGYFDWDRGKELRRKLVDSFLQSVWRPGDLAVASREPNLLRKIFKRLLQKGKGRQYAEAMYKDLLQRTANDASKLTAELAGLMRHPNFHEEWL